MIPSEEEMRDIKAKTLRILATFDAFCREHDLKYSIGFGTLLGAVRHHGFIPWDDDIDVIMPRVDYDRFIELTLNDFVPGYKVLSMYNDPNYLVYFAKIIDVNTTLISSESRKEFVTGAFIDVFPVDAIPDDPKLAEKQRLGYNRHAKMVYALRPSSAKYLTTTKKKILRFLLKPFTNHIAQLKKGQEIARKYAGMSTKKVRMFNLAGNKRPGFDSDIFDNLIDMQFEDLTVKAFARWDYFLTKEYGDYMQLPPVEKRVTQHSYYFYDFNRRWTIDELRQKGIID